LEHNLQIETISTPNLVIIMTAMETMNEPGLRVLILGSGAREHALAWKLSNEPKMERIVISPEMQESETKPARSPAHSKG
jgi:hypothetical protein